MNFDFKMSFEPIDMDRTRVPDDLEVLSDAAGLLASAVDDEVGTIWQSRVELYDLADALFALHDAAPRSGRRVA